MVKNLLASAGDIRDMGSIPGSGRSPGEGHGNQPQYSCLENPMDRAVWWATVHRVAKSRTERPHFLVKWPSLKKNLQTINAGEGVEKREPSYAVDGNVSWCSHYGEQYGGSLKN